MVQNLVFLTHCARGTIATPDNSQWNKKNMAQQKFEPEPIAWEIYVLTALPGPNF